MSSGYRRDLMELIQRHGWSAERTKGNHWRLRHPLSPRALFASNSPRKPFRALANVKADILRAMRQYHIPIP